MAKSEFGTSGIYSLAAIVGVSDIDPFVLNLAQGGTAGVPNAALAAAILIAASSNNMLKAFYAACFAGGSATAGSAVALVLLAVAGIARRDRDCHVGSVISPGQAVSGPCSFSGWSGRSDIRA